MTKYLLTLLAITALCAFWAIFQLWLSKHDPDAKTRSEKCGGCGREDECRPGHAPDPGHRPPQKTTGATCA